MSEFNRTVYLPDGSMMLCTYSKEEAALGPLWIVIFVLSLLLNAFSLFGNTAVIIACFLQKNRPPLIIYIHALAISDLCYSLIVPFYINRYVLQYLPPFIINFSLSAEIAHHLTTVGEMFASISNWLVVALTIDRTILAKLPFKASALSTTRRAVITVLVVVSCSFCLNAITLYGLFESPIVVIPCYGYWFVPKTITRENGTTYVPLLHHPAFKAYTVFTYVVLFYALPVVIILVCNVIIIRWLKETKKVGDGPAANAAARKLQEQRLTKMIAIVSVTFIICNIPDIVTRLLFKYGNTLTAAKVQPVGNLFLLVNASANFLVYSLFNKHLFRTLVQLLNRCRKVEDSSTTTAETSTKQTTNQAVDHIRK